MIFLCLDFTATLYITADIISTSKMNPNPINVPLFMDSPKIHRSTIRVFQKETVTQIPGTRPILKKKS